MRDTNSKIEMNNDRQRRQKNIIVYNLTEEKELVKAAERSNRQKIEKEINGNVQN